MPNNTTITPGTGETITTVDLVSSGFAYPTTGKAPAGVIFSGPSAAVAPAPVSNANPFPVSIQGAATTSLNVSALNAGATALTPKFKAVNLGATGDTVVVEPVSGKSLVVLGYAISFNSSFAAFFKSAAGNTQISRKMSGVQYASSGRSCIPVGCFATVEGEGLSINCASAGAVDGSVEVTYVEV